MSKCYEIVKQNLDYRRENIRENQTTVQNEANPNPRTPTAGGPALNRPSDLSSCPCSASSRPLKGCLKVLSESLIVS